MDKYEEKGNVENRDRGKAIEEQRNGRQRYSNGEIVRWTDQGDGRKRKRWVG